MKTVTQKSWVGTPPSHCDICKTELGTEFYDFRVPTVGQWANGCKACFKRYGGRLGTGLGQKYVRQDDGKFNRVEG